MVSGEADWDNLPKLAAYSILDKLYEVIDRIRFGAVSINWRIIAKEYKDHNPKRELPMLLVPATNNHNKRRLYSILQQKIYPNIHLAVPNEICIGSCLGGWLAFANHETLVIKLINPFKDVDPIELPPLEWEDGVPEKLEFKIKKVVLSADPILSPNNYVVLTIYGNCGRLRAFKSGQNKWGNIDPNNWMLFCDFILCKNIFYAITNFGDILSFDVNRIDSYDKLEVNVVYRDTIGYTDIPRTYIVESSKGDLLMVERDFVTHYVKKGEVRKTKSIKVYKLVLDATSGKLVQRVEITSLDDDAMFIGFNYSWCVRASEFPNCKPNSIYFTNDFFQLLNLGCGPCDMGVYNMEDQSFGEFYKCQVADVLFKPRVWIFPPV